MQPTYWCDRHLIVTVEGPDGRSSVTLEKPFARIGSHESSDVLLPSKKISRRRLYFHATPAGVFCVDLGHVRSAVAPMRGWISPEKKLTVGPFLIGVRAIGEETTPAEKQTDLEVKVASSLPPPPRVAVLVGGKEIGQRDLARPLTVVGRRWPSTLRITSHSVSASHCVLFREDETLWVVDLLSVNHTLLNGQPVEVAQLQPGQVLELGRASLLHLEPFVTGQTEDTRGIASDDPVAGEADWRRVDSDHEQADGSHVPPPAASWTDQQPPARVVAERERLDGERAVLEQERENLAEARAEAQRRRELLDTQQAEYERRREQFEAQQATDRVELEAARRRQQAELEEFLLNRDEMKGRVEATEARLRDELAALEKLHRETENERQEFHQQRDTWNQRRRQWEEEAARGEIAMAQQVRDIQRRLNELDAKRPKLEG